MSVTSSYHPEVEGLLRAATQTIGQLRWKIRRLEGENAKLRKKIESHVLERAQKQADE